MSLTVTNLTLVILTLVGVWSCGVALARLRRTLGPGLRQVESPIRRPGKAMLNAPVSFIAVGAAGLLLLRWWRSGGGWNPLAAHVDGLLLIASIMAAVGLYIQSRPRLGGLAAFYLPMLTLLLLWAVCASAWTYQPFGVNSLHPVWQTVHLAGVYLGTLGCCVAAVAGGMYLFVERQLKAKRNPRGLLNLASLETLERIIVQGAALGFALLTLGLIGGLVILGDGGDLDGGWWYRPKILLAGAAWLIYAVVMNVRFATTFRGRRAAWLAIGGLLLLLAVYAVVTAGHGDGEGLSGIRPPRPRGAAG
jgi:ABC-type uncharacterized transport system permease subunit